MFFFFPFYTESKSFSNGSGSSHARTLPLLPASGSARTNSRSTERTRDFGDFGVDFLRQVISAFTSSLTALGNRANALFAQLTAMLAFGRVARDSMTFINSALTSFGLPKAGTPFGLYQGQDPLSFSPFMMGNLNPLAMNPLAAFTEGMKFWTNLWMPAATQRNPYSFRGNAPASPFMAKVSTPGGFTWGFSWGQ